MDRKNLAIHLAAGSAVSEAAADPTTLSSQLAPSGFVADDTNAFFLSTDQYATLQRYLDAANHLPLTPADLVSRLGISTDDANQFQDMLDIYSQMQLHCSSFKSNTLTPMITLAEDIANYADDAAGTYLPALNDIIDAWQDVSPSDPAFAKLSAKFQAALGILADAAKDNQQKAIDMQKKVTDFTDQTKSDQAILQPIQKKYEDKYTAAGGEIDQLKTEIQGDSEQIEYWNNEYQKDIKIACTSATYAWVVPVGTIAAAIVAGIYGDKAKQALDKVHDFQNDMAAKTTKEKQDVQMMADLQICEKSMAGILDALQDALAVLEKMEGIWTALAGDIAAVQAKYNTMASAKLIIKDVIADACISAWTKISTESRNFVVNAYVTFVSEAEITSSDPAKWAVPKAA